MRALRRVFRLGIRGRLLLLTLPVVNVVFAAIWLVVTTTTRDGVLSLSSANLQSAATAGADAIERSILDTYSDALMAARLDITAQAIAGRNTRNLTEHADELVRSRKRYAALVVTDAGGIIVAANTVGREGRPIPRLTGRRLGQEPPLANESWVKELLGQSGGAGGPVRVPLGEPRFLAGLLDSDERALGVGLPVLDGVGRRIGAVVLLLSSHHLGELLDSQTSTVGDNVDTLSLITDSKGRVVILPRALRENAGWVRAGVAILPDSGKGDALWTSPDGIAFLHRSRGIPSARKSWDFHLVGLRTLARVEQPVRELSSRLFVVFFLGSLLTTAMLVRGRHLVRGPDPATDPRGLTHRTRRRVRADPGGADRRGGHPDRRLQPHRG